MKALLAVVARGWVGRVGGPAVVAHGWRAWAGGWTATGCGGNPPHPPAPPPRCSYEYSVDDPGEGWTRFPIGRPAKGMPMSFRRLQN